MSVTSTDREYIWARPVSRVPGSPTTILQDTVDGTSASLRTEAAVQALAAQVAHIKARVDLLTGGNISALAVQIATDLAARLSGENGHIMSDGDIDRFAQETADRVVIYLQQQGGGAA